MNPEIERRVFGYIDTFPPITDGYKDKVLRTLEFIEAFKTEEELEFAIIAFEIVVKNMRQKNIEFFRDKLGVQI